MVFLGLQVGKISVYSVDSKGADQDASSFFF